MEGKIEETQIVQQNEEKATNMETIKAVSSTTPRPSVSTTECSPNVSSPVSSSPVSETDTKNTKTGVTETNTTPAPFSFTPSISSLPSFNTVICSISHNFPTVTAKATEFFKDPKTCSKRIYESSVEWVKSIKQEDVVAAFESVCKKVTKVVKEILKRLPVEETYEASKKWFLKFLEETVFPLTEKYGNAARGMMSEQLAKAKAIINGRLLTTVNASNAEKTDKTPVETKTPKAKKTE